jgi:multisubunit Na+/H+ antiporter MnhB subunit
MLLINNKGGMKMKDRKEIVASILVAVGVLTTLFFYLMSSGDIGLNEILLVSIVLILVALAMYIVWDRIKNVQKGLPAKDERLVNINYKAGYYAFIAAIWSAVLGPTLADIVWGYELDGGDVTAIVVLVSGFVFVLSYLYLARRGK